MCAGNGACTLIDRRFAARLGLVDFDGRPTQAYTQTARGTGVAGAVTEFQIINIQYKIKGTLAKGPNCNSS